VALGRSVRQHHIGAHAAVGREDDRVAHSLAGLDSPS
jgi:hypothetical protein